MALVGHYRADMGVTLNGGDVSALADQSGNGNHLTQATAIRQPAYLASGHLGHPLIRFEGAEWLAGAVGALNLGTSDVTVVLVGKEVTVNTSRILGKVDGNTANESGWHILTLAAGAFRTKIRDLPSTNLRDKQSSDSLITNDTLFTGGFNLNQSTDVLNNYVNGVLHNEVDLNSGAGMGSVDCVETFKIGAAGDGSSVPWVGDFFEVKIFNSLEDIATLSASMLAFWGAQATSSDPQLLPPTIPRAISPAIAPMWAP